MMIGQLHNAKIDLIRALGHLAADCAKFILKI